MWQAQGHNVLPLATVDPETLAQAATIVADVRREGTAGLIGAIERFERRAGDPVLLDREDLKAAFLSAR